MAPFGSQGAGGFRATSRVWRGRSGSHTHDKDESLRAASDTHSPVGMDDRHRARPRAICARGCRPGATLRLTRFDSGRALPIRLNLPPPTSPTPLRHTHAIRDALTKKKASF